MGVGVDTVFAVESTPGAAAGIEARPCAKGELAFGRLPHGLWVHPEVPDGLGGMTPLRQRLGIVLQYLAAHGRTTVVKGCRDVANRGWRGSPLGGSGGMQHYLWWTVQGSAPARDITFPGCGGVLVRAVRHHDHHGRLDAGVLDDYLPFSQHEIIVQSGPTQSTRRLHMEMGTPTPSSPLSCRNQGHHSRSRESAPNSHGSPSSRSAPTAADTALDISKRGDRFTCGSC